MPGSLPCPRGEAGRTLSAAAGQRRGSPAATRPRAGSRAPLLRLAGHALLLGLFAPANNAVAERYLHDAERGNVIGSLQAVTSGAEDTLPDLARRHGLGYNDVRLANAHLDTLLPGNGVQVTLPARYVLPDTRRRGVVLNIPEMRMYYYPPDQENEIWTYPIGVGREGWSIPYKSTRVIGKQQRPSWYPPESIREEHALAGDPLPRVVPPGPDNPLGEHAIRLALPGYLIHGTNKEYGIGMRVSHGCLRMYPEDIEEFYPRITVGTPVAVINQPVKAGIDGDLIYLEAHPPLAEEGWTHEQLQAAFTKHLDALAAGRPYRVDWTLADYLLQRPSGIPAAVGALLPP